MRKYKIGITFNLEAKVTDIWANGANQNVIHLYHLFQHSDIVDDVVLVSWGPEKRTTPPDGFMLNDLAGKLFVIKWGLITSWILKTSFLISLLVVYLTEVSLIVSG